MMVLVNFAKAQKTNTLAFEDALLDVWRLRALPVDSVTGFLTDRLVVEIHLTPGSKRKLLIEEPAVQITSLKQGRYLRKITSLISLVDSNEVGYPVNFQDTLSHADLGKVRKSQVPELRGVDPRWPAKYLAPVLLIGTGIAVIISLFYLRS